jgi:hypothetical protein
MKSLAQKAGEKGIYSVGTFKLGVTHSRIGYIPPVSGWMTSFPLKNHSVSGAICPLIWLNTGFNFVLTDVGIFV